MANWTLELDHTGRAVAVDVEGKKFDLEDDANLPTPHQVREFRDLVVNVGSTLEQMRDSYKGGAIVTRIEATHGGYKNGNNYHYVADGMKKSVGTWLKPVPAPFLINHDDMEEARGRVLKANYVKTGKATGYHDLDVRISHKDEIEMVLDGRSLTVSTGSAPIDTVECSTCGHDLYTDGQAPKRYAVDEMPDKAWLRKPAPGFFGAFGMTNEDFWGVEKDDDGNVTCSCSHMRHVDAPVDGGRFEDTFWYCHGQRYKEVSRVNNPADVNQATGEFARIREVLQQTDGLPEETRAKLLVEQLSAVESGPVDRARYSVVSEGDLWRAGSANEAADFAAAADDSAFWNKGLWIATCAMLDGLPLGDRARAYHEAGGEFVRPPAPALTVADAMALPTSEFYGWLRAQDFDRPERAALDAAYTQRYLRDLRASRA